MLYRLNGVVALLLVLAVPAWAEVRILACEPEWQALAEVLGGTPVRADSATTAWQDPHHIEARPSLIAKARRADMVFCTGAELEMGWLPLLLRQSGNRRIQVGQPGYFMAAEQVERIEVPTQLDRSHGDVHASGNPHVHLDPHRLLQVAQRFSERLVQIDPVQAGYYQARFADFRQRWLAAIQVWEQQAVPLRGKQAIVYHKNWSYLLSWLGIDVIGDLEPKPGIPPTSAHLARLLRISRQDQPDFILVAAYQDDQGARWLAQKSGVPVVVLPFTVGGSEQVDDLFALYTQTLSLLQPGP